MSKNTVDGNRMTKNVDSDVKHKPSDIWKKYTNEFIKVIKLKCDLYKSVSFLPYKINSFFTFKSSQLILA